MYANGAKRAKVLSRRFPAVQIVATAPFTELADGIVGLVSMIDDHHLEVSTLSSLCMSSREASLRCTRFASDYSRYVNGHSVDRFRKLVISTTNRIAKTFDFEAGNEEVKLYESVPPICSVKHDWFGQR